ncbi:MAG: terminase small subunit [Mucilaginibacter sp.]|uniref:terminase small subunit n=1 Tax=Mucilaginibacter sp. TaxID=1882438 RepID=UPI003265D7F0
MIRVTPNLSEQQICFCDEYLVSFNAYRSAINSGYSENTARKGELLHYPKIQEYLRMRMQERSDRMEITHDMILREYAKIAFSSMANYYDERGDLKPACELTETEMAAISFLETRNIAEPDGYIRGAVTRIKLHNKMAALDKIAKHLGFFEVKAKSSKQKAAEEQPEAECLKQEAFEEQITEEVAVVSETEEMPLAAVDGVEPVIDGGEEKDENILTLSPLAGAIGASYTDVLLNNRTTRGTLAGAVMGKSFARG